MKLSIDNGTVTCSLENKNTNFLAACAGMFDGFLNGKLKLYDYIALAAEGINPDDIIECNAELVKSVIQIAKWHGIEVSDEVRDYNNLLQERVKAIEEKQRLLEEGQERAEKWERLCRYGCGRCKDLSYLTDVPICKQTGEVLEDKPVPKEINGITYLFNMEAFPNEDCPFNNKKQGV